MYLILTMYVYGTCTYIIGTYQIPTWYIMTIYRLKPVTFEDQSTL